MTIEVWKDIPEFEGYYKVSNLGRVKRIARTTIRSNGKSDSVVYNVEERIKKIQKQTKGYSHVVLYKNGKYKTRRLNRLVALAFIPNPENKPEVNHIDGNKENNRADNLEWVTSKENHKHAADHNLLKYYMRRVAKVDKNGNIVAYYNSIKDAAIENNISKGNICTACRGQRKYAGGFIWRYE